MPDWGPEPPRFTDEEGEFMRKIDSSAPSQVADEDYSRLFHLRHDWQFPSNLIDEFVALSIADKRGTLDEDGKERMKFIWKNSFKPLIP